MSTTLLTPPTIADATRREVLAGLAAAGMLTGCGSAEPPAPAGPATREFTHAFGTSTIPVAPQRIVTTHDQNALLPLLELGVRPVGSAGVVDGPVRFRRAEGFDTNGIELIGAYGEANFEAVAALNPDLVIGFEVDVDFAPTLDRIAPFVGVQIFGRRLTEALVDFGDLTGRLDEATRLRQEYEARVTGLRAELATRHPRLTVSLLVAGELGAFSFLDTGQAVGTVAHDLDLGRPAAQASRDRLAIQTGDATSVELLGAHDADVVLVTDFFSDTGDTIARDAVAGPLWQQLTAARRGQLHLFDGSPTVGTAWARMNNFLDVVEQRLLADDLVATGVNA